MTPVSAYRKAAPPPWMSSTAIQPKHEHDDLRDSVNQLKATVLALVTSFVRREMVRTQRSSANRAAEVR